MIKNALNIIINHSFKMEATQHPPTGKWIKKKKSMVQLSNKIRLLYSIENAIYMQHNVEKSRHQEYMKYSSIPICSTVGMFYAMFYIYLIFLQF